MKTSEKIVAFAAIFISCLALVVSIIQTRIAHKQSVAAVWPRLTNGQGMGLDYFNYSIKNEGIGPAIISSVAYIYEDTTFYNINELIQYFGQKEARMNDGSIRLDYEYSALYHGAVIGAGETVESFIANDSTSVNIGKKYLLNTDVKIDYCSVYDDCWSMQNDVVIEL